MQRTTHKIRYPKLDVGGIHTSIGKDRVRIVHQDVALAQNQMQPRNDAGYAPQTTHTQKRLLGRRPYFHCAYIKVLLENISGNIRSDRYRAIAVLFETNRLQLQCTQGCLEISDRGRGIALQG